MLNLETTLLEFLIPSWWEVEVTVAAAAFLVAAYWFFTFGGAGEGEVDDRALVDGAVDGIDDSKGVQVIPHCETQFQQFIIYFNSFYFWKDHYIWSF